MAALYGRLHGNGGEATRCGSKDSGITASLETWNGSVRSRVEHDGEFTVQVGDKYGGPVAVSGNCDEGKGQDVYLHGTAAELAAGRIIAALDEEFIALDDRERALILDALRPPSERAS